MLRAVSRFSDDGGRADKRRVVIEKLSRYFEVFRGIGTALG
jgi:hypothetical protein